MKLQELLTDDDAVSPVIGVILMVAITVILAAVIGTFVLNLGGSVQQTAPQTSFEFDFNTSGSNSNLTVTHATGDTIDTNKAGLKIVVGNSSKTVSDASPSSLVNGSDTHDNVLNYTSTTVGAGDAAEVKYDGGWDGETVRVVWTSENGETSVTLSKSEAPDES